MIHTLRMMLWRWLNAPDPQCVGWPAMMLSLALFAAIWAYLAYSCPPGLCRVLLAPVGAAFALSLLLY